MLRLTGAFYRSLMSSIRVVSHQRGLTLSQWGLLFVAFMLGLGGTFVIREVFLPESVHAGVVRPAAVQTAPDNTVAFVPVTAR